MQLSLFSLILILVRLPSPAVTHLPASAACHIPPGSPVAVPSTGDTCTAGSERGRVAWPSVL